MSYQDVEQFDNQILNIENPQLQRYLINGEDVLPVHDLKYVHILLDYVNKRKNDYYANIPKEQ